MPPRHGASFPQELKLKDEECERLSKVREQLEQELEELTASLFEVRAQGTVGSGSAGRPSHPPTHAEPALFPGSPQDGASRQHEAGSVRKAAEGGPGQGEALLSPDLPPTSQPCMHWPLRPNRTLA